MITANDIQKGKKIETKVGVIEIGETDTYTNFKLDNGTIVAEFYMVDTVMNGNKYRTELNDLVSFINENS
jgi:hypothetical protein